MTNNLKRRVEEHKKGKTWSTKRLGGDIELIGYFTCKTKQEAVDLESKIKRSKNTKRRIQYDSFVKMGR